MTIYFTQSSLPSGIGREPKVNAVWPVSPRRSILVPQRSSSKPGRGIGASRSNGTRAHCGIDIFAKHPDKILAMEDGIIVSFYQFAGETFALFVDHGDFVANYGEVSRDSLVSLGLKTPYYRERNKRAITATVQNYKQYPVAETGSIVKAGQQIATVGILPGRSSMLHLEFYSPGVRFNHRWLNFPTGSHPSTLKNPTDYMVILANRNPRVATQESQSVAACS